MEQQLIISNVFAATSSVVVRAEARRRRTDRARAIISRQLALPRSNTLPCQARFRAVMRKVEYREQRIGVVAVVFGMRRARGAKRAISLGGGGHIPSEGSRAREHARRSAARGNGARDDQGDGSPRIGSHDPNTGSHILSDRRFTEDSALFTYTGSGAAGRGGSGSTDSISTSRPPITRSSTAGGGIAIRSSCTPTWTTMAGISRITRG